MSRAPRTLKKQKEFIIEFLEEHRFLLGGKINQTNLTKLNKTWETFVEKLNKIGPGKTIRQWKETISEMKTNVRRRARDIKYGHAATGGGPAVKPLTDLEERLLSLVSNLNVEGMNLSEAGIPEKENETPNFEAACSFANGTPVLIQGGNMPLDVTFENQTNIPLVTENEVNIIPTTSANPVPLQRKTKVRGIPKRSRIQQNTLDKHDKALMYMARSNFAVARAVNNLAKSVGHLAKKT